MIVSSAIFFSGGTASVRVCLAKNKKIQCFLSLFSLRPSWIVDEMCSLNRKRGMTMHTKLSQEFIKLFFKISTHAYI